MSTDDKPRLLLHVCCAPCAGACLERLRPDYQVTLFFYNPNIHPVAEYRARAEEVRRWAAQEGVTLIKPDYDAPRWFELVKGHETDPEKGPRCAICFRMRLTETARVAVEGAFELFATTLTISPHKVTNMVFRAGQAAAKEHGIKFLAQDFKKQGGFQRSLEISRQYGFYRQDYCGCIFSRREAEQRRRAKEKGPR